MVLPFWLIPFPLDLNDTIGGIAEVFINKLYIKILTAVLRNFIMFVCNQPTILKIIMNVM